MKDGCEDAIPLNWARRRGRAAKAGPAAIPALPRIPRITRLMALAIKFDEMIRSGEVHDYADLARLGYVTRARMTQIMNLLLLAPDIQAQILSWTDCTKGSRHLAEHEVRDVAHTLEWEPQRKLWRSLFRRQSLQG